jgi:hypothetical protein
MAAGTPPRKTATLSLGEDGMQITPDDGNEQVMARPGAVPGWCEQPREFKPHPNATKRQIGGDHYSELPEHYQPIVIAKALDLAPWEYNVLKRLLRHRKKHGKVDLQKAIHDLELGIQLEYPE